MAQDIICSPWGRTKGHWLLLNCYSFVFLYFWIFSLLRLNLFFGTWRRPRRLNFSSKQEAWWGGGRVSVLGRPQRVLLSYLGTQRAAVLHLLSFSFQMRHFWKSKGTVLVTEAVGQPAPPPSSHACMLSWHPGQACTFLLPFSAEIMAIFAFTPLRPVSPNQLPVVGLSQLLLVCWTDC